MQLLSDWMRLIHRVTTLPLMALYLLMSFGGSGGVVLCLGEDGHVGIELEKNGSCVESSNQATESLDCQIDNEPHCHCGPCLDIPLGIKTAGVRSASFRDSSYWSKILASGFSHEYRPFLPKQAKTTKAAYLIAPPSVNQTILCLRTVFLLL